MAMQEFLASYAVQVDEDGARRLQSILEENREAGSQLAAVFDSARAALEALKKELSDSVDLKNILPGLTSGGNRTTLPAVSLSDAISRVASSFSSASAALPELPVSFSSLRLSADLSAAQQEISDFQPDPINLSVEADLSDAREELARFSSVPSTLDVEGDFSAAEEALSSFRSRLESERPRVSVNASGITSAVSSAIASIRSMMGSLSVTVPVKAVASLDTSGLKGTGGSSGSGSASFGGVLGSLAGLPGFGSGGRVDSPTLAMIAEEGRPEYIIPTNNDSRAVPLLRGLLTELSESARKAVFSPSSLDSDLSASLASLSASARASFLPAGVSSPQSIHSVQAPVNIHVSSSAAAPEAVARSIYDTAQRSLLKTLKGVFT